MTITNNPSLQTAGCFASYSSNIMRGLSNASSAIAESAKKIAFISSIYFMKAAALTRATTIQAWNITKGLGHETAEIAKRIGHLLFAIMQFVGHQTVQLSIALSHIVKKCLFVASIYLNRAAIQAKAALQTGWVATKYLGNKTGEAVKTLSLATFALLKASAWEAIRVSQKVGHFAATHFLKALHFTAQRCSDAKDGIVQGLNISRHFFATHQKETALVGCGVAAGLVTYYAINRFFGGAPKAHA